MMQPINDVIEQFQLEKHPEGGYYKRFYTCPENTSKPIKGYSGNRPLSTSILYLLPKDDFSAFHIIKQDETWYFHMGNPLKIHEILPDGTLQSITLGLGFVTQQTPVYTVKGGYHFNAVPEGDLPYTLVSCSVTPGFHFDDFELSSWTKIKSQYPDIPNSLEQYFIYE